MQTTVDFNVVVVRKSRVDSLQKDNGLLHFIVFNVVDHRVLLVEKPKLDQRDEGNQCGDVVYQLPNVSCLELSVLFWQQIAQQHARKNRRHDCKVG